LPSTEPGLLDGQDSVFDAARFPGGGTGEPSDRGTGAENDGGPGPGVGSGEKHRIGGDLRPPTKLRHIAPEYPELARRVGVRGTVILECTIDPSGRVVDARVITGNPLLAPAALDAVRGWSYTPTLLNGRAVSVLMTVSVRFNLAR
jgi:periplasmic protein TonB